MTDQLDSAATLLDWAAAELERAADEGPPHSTWGAELRQEAKHYRQHADRLRAWLGRKA